MKKKQPKKGDLIKYIGHTRITGIVVSRAAGWADVAWSDGERGMIRDCDIEVICESR